MKESILSHVREELRGTMHYEKGEKALISALESVYGNNEIPATNPILVRQRSLAVKGELMWNKWWQGSPQIQAEIDGDKRIFFDHRLPDPGNLKDFPLLDPKYLRDNWSRIKGGAVPVPLGYLDLLVSLSGTGPASGVWSVPHSDIMQINKRMDIPTAEDQPYYSGFLGVTPEERKAYGAKHRIVHGDIIGLYCNLNDANQDEERGRVSVFNLISLGGDDSLSIGGARLFGVRRRWASTASHSAEGAAENAAFKSYLGNFVPPARLDECMQGALAFLRNK